MEETIKENKGTFSHISMLVRRMNSSIKSALLEDDEIETEPESIEDILTNMQKEENSQESSKEGREASKILLEGLKDAEEFENTMTETKKKKSSNQSSLKKYALSKEEKAKVTEKVPKEAKEAEKDISEDKNAKFRE